MPIIQENEGASSRIDIALIRSCGKGKWPWYCKKD